MELDATTLAALAANVWESMLGIELTPGPGETPADRGHSLTACVQITGDWVGAVTVRCPAGSAGSFAATMFGCPAEDLSVEEIRDALGELTNMTAGSVKGLMEGSCHLGLPAVAEGLDYQLTVPKSKVVSVAEFDHQGATLEVALFQGS